ncbi:hypothetical protein PQ610_06890 [Tardisphaera miroshnichenkoae]
MSSDRGTAIKYGLAYGVTLAIYLLLLASRSGSLASLFFAAALIPLWLGLTLALAGSLVQRASVNADGKTVGLRASATWELGFLITSAIAPSAGLYLFLKAALGYFASLVALTPSELGYAARFVAAAYVVGVGGITYRAGSQHPGEGPAASIYYKMALALALYGLGSFFGLLNGYAEVPLAFAAFVAFAFAIAQLVLAVFSLKWPEAALRASVEAERNYGRALAAFFVIGIFYSLLMATNKPQYAEIAWLTVIVLMFIAASAFFFRSYSAMAGTANKIAERIYEQHQKEVKEFVSDEDELYVRMISDFLREGKKERLLVFAAYRLSACGMDYEDISGALKKLIEYEPFSPSALWPWEMRSAPREMEKDLELRKSLVNEVIELVNGCANLTAGASHSSLSSQRTNESNAEKFKRLAVVYLWQFGS